MTLVLEVDLEREIDKLTDAEWVHEYLPALNEIIGKKEHDLGRWKR